MILSGDFLYRSYRFGDILRWKYQNLFSSASLVCTMTYTQTVSKEAVHCSSYSYRQRYRNSKWVTERFSRQIDGISEIVWESKDRADEKRGRRSVSADPTTDLRTRCGSYLAAGFCIHCCRHWDDCNFSSLQHGRQNLRSACDETCFVPRTYDTFGDRTSRNPVYVTTRDTNQFIRVANRLVVRERPRSTWLFVFLCAL